MDLPIFTIQTFNQNSLRAAGAVFAHRVDLVKSPPKGLFSGGATPSNFLANTAMEQRISLIKGELMKILNEEAINKYTNDKVKALVDIKMDFSLLGESLLGQASATVLVERIKPVAPMSAPAPISAPAPMSAPAPVSAPAPMSAPMPNARIPNARIPNARIPSEPANPLPATGGKYRSKLGKSRKNRL
jgi:hypothetical protein